MPASRDALQGLRVVELGGFVTAAYCSKMMADMGAEAIKVESNQRPDGARVGHACLKDIPGQSMYGMSTLRNQLSVSLNLSTPEGRETARRLIQVSDVVMENFSPGVVASLGLDYPSLRKLAPDVIMISMSAAGATGPWKDMRIFGASLSALAGLLRA